MIAPARLAGAIFLGEDDMAEKGIVRKNSASKKRTSAARQQLMTYCESIRKQQGLIAKLQQQRIETYSRFQQELLPAEQQFIQLLYNNTLRLCELASRKSLSRTQRDHLIFFIEDNVDVLRHHPFTNHVDISALLTKALCLCAQLSVTSELDEIDSLREYINGDRPEGEGFSDEELLEIFRDPQKMEEVIQAKQQQEQASDDDDLFADDFDFSPDDEQRQAQHKKLDSLFSDSVIKTMYKRLASALHPDKEMNEASRKEKHDLMVQLTQARKDHDVWTIFEMYQQHIDGNADFSDDEIPVINQLLKQRLSALKAEYESLWYDESSIEGLIWSQFSGRTSKSIEKKLDSRRTKLREMTEVEENMIAHLSSVKSVQQYLKTHRRHVDELSELFIEQMFDDLYS
ncbi:hypothetical protein [Pluralibacter sp.]|uniref:hypothetical protein n=1 Tax=Pluralibacter sp. TaxID=1920032 RepID=UPI0025FE8C6B|nr:hypothetical protein [Pluralibacter sp.]MBV8042713.1 hypothetical protein [Pluralibacter sp.]